MWNLCKRFDPVLLSTDKGVLYNISVDTSWSCQSGLQDQTEHNVHNESYCEEDYILDRQQSVFSQCTCRLTLMQNTLGIFFHSQKTIAIWKQFRWNGTQLPLVGCQCSTQLRKTRRKRLDLSSNGHMQIAEYIISYNGGSSQPLRWWAMKASIALTENSEAVYRS